MTATLSGAPPPSAALSAVGGAVARKPVNKWLVTLSITFGTLMGTIDASIVSVAVPPDGTRTPAPNILSGGTTVPPSVRRK